MYIHTINFNYNDTNKLITNLKIWKNEDIKKIIKEKYLNLVNYYNNLLLNKSRENIAKLIGTTKQISVQTRVNSPSLSNFQELTNKDSITFHEILTFAIFKFFTHS